MGNAAFGKPQPSDVKDGYCYIDRHCYAAGEASPYTGHGCFQCNPEAPSATANMEWTGPVVGTGTSHCFIGNMCIEEGAFGKMPDGVDRYGRPKFKDDPCAKCIPSVSSTEYTPIAAGCMLTDMTTFTAACYDDKGAITMNETAKLQLMEDKASMTTALVEMSTTVGDRDDTISKLKEENAALQGEKNTMTKNAETKEATISTLRAAK